MTLGEIEKLTREYAKQRGALEEKVAEMQTEIGLVRRRHLEGIKRCIERAGEAHQALFEALSEAPELFQRPKSLLISGILVGYRKERDRFEWIDSEKLADAIKERFPDLYSKVVKVTQRPLEKALMLFDLEVLNELGVTLDVGKDRVIIEASNTEIDKLVEALVREAEEQAAGS
jgi:hypothetical protein